MIRRITKLLLVGFLTILLVWIVISSVHTLRLHCIKQHAKEVKEPFYTLVVNGKIIQHTYTVHFDRYHYDAVSGLREGYVDGRIEIPLLTVLGAMGVECSEVENGVILLEYFGKKYYFVPEKQAIYAATTEETFHADLSNDSLAGNQQEWDNRNLLLVLPNIEDGYFREERGEYIVDLGSLHKLVFYMDFTFDFDCERGIVYFSSDTSTFPGHCPPPSH